MWRALEPVHALGRVLDEPPVASSLHLQPLDHQLVSPPPPLRHELGVGECLPHEVAGSVEDALDPDLPVAGSAQRRLAA